MEDLVELEEIRSRNIDVEHLSKRAISDEPFRNEIVRQLINNKDIMVYYHCYYILQRASETRADLFYTYWDDFASLIGHENSYHRDIGASMIANLASADTNHYLDNIMDAYLEHIYDEKFMTAQCFIRNLAKIIKSREDLSTKIVTALIAGNEDSPYPEKQRELLKCSMLEVLDTAYETSSRKEAIDTFIQEALVSKSPKTKKKATELLSKYHLQS